MQTVEINMMIFWGCVAIGAVVYAMIIWSLVAYRKSKKQEASFHKHTLTEIAWTVIPLLIIIAMTIPAARLLTRVYQGEGAETEGMQRDLVEQQGRQVVFDELNLTPVLLAGSARARIT